MIMAPIDGREFSAASRRRRKSPAVCQFPQFLRLLAIVTIAGLLLSVVLAPERAKADEFATSEAAQTF